VLHQAPAAAIELRPNVSAPTIEELKRHVRDHLPSTHVPVHWRFVPSMPLNSAYKIDRGRLRQLFEAGEGRA
jgi:acyl-coenzyme A synthetase/AMP-(fatty) acid ligase